MYDRKISHCYTILTEQTDLTPVIMKEMYGIIVDLPGQEAPQDWILPRRWLHPLGSIHASSRRESQVYFRVSGT